MDITVNFPYQHAVSNANWMLWFASWLNLWRNLLSFLRYNRYLLLLILKALCLYLIFFFVKFWICELSQVAIVNAPSIFLTRNFIEIITELPVSVLFVNVRHLREVLGLYTLLVVRVLRHHIFCEHEGLLFLQWRCLLTWLQNRLLSFDFRLSFWVLHGWRLLGCRGGLLSLRFS